MRRKDHEKNNFNFAANVDRVVLVGKTVTLTVPLPELMKPFNRFPMPWGST
jgi:hypothetical protein